MPNTTQRIAMLLVAVTAMGCAPVYRFNDGPPVRDGECVSVPLSMLWWDCDTPCCDAASPRCTLATRRLRYQTTTFEMTACNR